jgi:osmotically-inducible protein OsmY
MTREIPWNVELQNAVTAALELSDGLETTLAVSAHEGTVTLAGSVDDEIDVVAAQDIAEKVPGVTEVAVEIALRRPRDEGAG